MPLHRLLNRPGYPLTERCWKNSLSLPIYPSLTAEELDRTLRAVAARASYPQVYINGEHVGGADELEAWLRGRRAA